MSGTSSQVKRILVVDDDESIRALFSQALRAGGFEVKTAHNGREAFDIVAKFAPDLIVLDLVMPEQEGIETILQLHAAYPGIPVIAVSGALGAPEYLHVAHLLGARRSLVKPIKPDQLVQTVRAVLEEQSAASA